MEKRRFFRRRRLEKRELIGLPNYITYGRILLIPVIAGLIMPLNDLDDRFIRWDFFASYLAMILFAIASLSDLVDGYYARKYNFTSSFGKFIDPLADKLLTITVLIVLVSLHRAPAWVVVILIGREVAITTLRAVAADEGIVIAASPWGKSKTTMGNFALGFLIAHYPVGGLNVHGIGMVLLALTFLVSIGSGVHYIVSFFSELFERKGTVPP